MGTTEDCMTTPFDARRTTLPIQRPTLLGARIRAWCTATQTTQSRLAERLDVEQGMISRIVHGTRTPSRELARRIADELGMPHADMALLYFEIDPETTRTEMARTWEVAA